MKATLAIVIAGVAFAVTASPARAHHSFASAYDVKRPVTLIGTVTRLEWTNPHTHFFVDVQDDKGHTDHWKLELASPQVLLQSGWRANYIHIGDTVTIEGARARDGSFEANARIVTLPDGHRLSAGSSGGDVPPR